MRITQSSPDLPLVERGKKIMLKVDGESIEAYEGEMVSTVLLSMGIKNFGRSNQSGRDHGVFCGMGICYECLVTVNGQVVRACQTPVTEGMIIETRSEVVL